MVKRKYLKYLHFAGENKGAARLHSITGGLRENMVPESSLAPVVSGDLADLQARTGKMDFRCMTELKRREFKKTVNHPKITYVSGKSAHGIASPASVSMVQLILLSSSASLLLKDICKRLS